MRLSNYRKFAFDLKTEIFRKVVEHMASISWSLLEQDPHKGGYSGYIPEGVYWGIFILFDPSTWGEW